MNRTFILVGILIIVFITAVIYFSRGNSEENNTKIIRKGNTFQVPVGMVTDGLPPDASTGP